MTLLYLNHKCQLNNTSLMGLSRNKKMKNNKFQKINFINRRKKY